MAITYEWKLTGLRKQNTDTLTDVIIGTNWTVTATDEDGNTGTFTGATPFSPKDLNGDGFVDYKDLTEELVLGWIQNVVSGSNLATNYWDHINGRIMEQINSTKYNRTEVSTTQFPWNGGEDTPISGSVPL